MSFVFQDCALSLLATTLILLLLVSSSSCASKTTQSNVKSAVFLSPKFGVEPGQVANKFYYDIEFPRGHIGVKSVNAEIVDEAGNSIPLHETYVHHWVFVRYYQRKNVSHTEYPNRWIFPHKDYVLKRNSGMCPRDVLAQYFGLGSETRRTRADIPHPFGIEIGNPQEIPQGFEEKWMLNLHAIDTRGVEDKTGCTECRCDLYNTTKNEDGLPLSYTYKGGFLCCYDNTHCKLKEGFKGANRNLYLKYTIKWVEWEHSMAPLEVYILDVTNSIQIPPNGNKGVTSNHNCWVEYEIEPHCNIKILNEDFDGCIDVKRTSIPRQVGGYLIYAVAHQHSGAFGSTLYGQDGRVLCTSKPIYGTGKEAGNEEGYVVEMSTCYPKPGSVKINENETLIIESNYTSEKRRTGVMNNFYLLVAKNLPNQYLENSSIVLPNFDL